MKAVIKAIVYFLIGLTVIFYGGAYMLPGEVRVSRSVQIAAPPGEVFAIVGDLRRWPEWSALTDVDPAVAFTFGGAEQAGVGQVLRWASNNPAAGNGALTVTEFVPGERLILAVDYGEFGAAVSALDIAPADGGTRVTWDYSAEMPGVVDRWAGLMVDRQAGAEHERALVKLKALAEAAASGN
jgi:uncharacterized protein YndB with AHSA1/START domain